MPADGLIHYDHSAMAEGVDDMLRANTNIENMIGELEQQTKALVDAMGGETKDSYYATANQIYQTLGTNNAALEQTGKAVGVSDGDVSAADTAHAKMMHLG
jgi:WXG100 family type VII secretion target